MRAIHCNLDKDPIQIQEAQSDKVLSNLYLIYGALLSGGSPNEAEPHDKCTNEVLLLGHHSISNQ